MSPWIAAAVAGGAASTLLTAWLRHRRRRDRMYASLAAARPAVVVAHPVTIGTTACPETLSATFARDRYLAVPDFVTADCLAALREEALANLERAERSYIPTHKKGGTIAYETIHRVAPRCLSFYHSPTVQAWVSAVVGQRVFPTPDQDQSSLSLLCYTEAGDHINWHYDHNFYCGRHFTVLLPLVNDGPAGPSQSRYQRRTPRGEILTTETDPNLLVMFEGARVLHRATPAGPGDLRIVLSMTYCTDPRNSRLKEAVRRVKDTAFFGLRALWD
uniref:Fe2OG dioxygenase domain-containing protein n=1 Tax=Schlesneria paludicola TaxID=360056 RepID=A0A7C2PH32_9PLAN